MKKKLDKIEALTDLGCDPVTAAFILAIESGELSGDAVDVESEEEE